MKLEVRLIPIAGETDIVLARIAGAELADGAGFEVVGRHCVMTSISELAANILRHAGSGIIELRIVAGPYSDEGLEVVARDQGQGIEDVALALQDHYTTGGGLGCGLPGVRRLMSDLEITSSFDTGTMVKAVKWRSDNHLRRPLLPVADAE